MPEKVEKYEYTKRSRSSGEAAYLPPEVFDEVRAEVARRVLTYGQKAEELKTKGDAAQLAKDLGK